MGNYSDFGIFFAISDRLSFISTFQQKMSQDILIVMFSCQKISRFYDSHLDLLNYGISIKMGNLSDFWHILNISARFSFNPVLQQKSKNTLIWYQHLLEKFYTFEKIHPISCNLVKFGQNWPFYTYFYILYTLEPFFLKVYK